MLLPHLEPSHERSALHSHLLFKLQVRPRLELHGWTEQSALSVPAFLIVNCLIVYTNITVK